MFQELWFSYSGAQHQMIHALAVQLDDAGIRQRTLNPPQADNIIQGLKISPLLYRLDGESENDDSWDGRPRYQLHPGASIADLLDDIANCIVKVLVLSEEYFKSEYCVQEFCLSYLVKFSQQNPILPMRLFVGGNFNNSNYLAKQYELVISGQVRQLSGEEIVKQIFGELFHQYKSDDRYQFDDSAEDFLQRIKDHDCRVSSRLNNIDQAPAVAEDVYRYVFSELSKLPPHAQYINFISQLYERWKQNPFAEKLLSHIPKNLRNISLLQNKENMKDFLRQVVDVLKNKKIIIEDNNDRKKVHELFGLVLWRQIRPYSSQLLTYCMQSGSVPQLEVEDSADTGWRNALAAAMAFATANQVKLLSPDQSSHVEGIHFIDKTGVSCGDQDVADAVRNLAASLMKGYDNYPSTMSIDEIKNDPDFVYDVRAAIEDIPSGEYGVLVISKEGHRNSQGRYEIIERIKDLLKLDQHNLKLPYIILKQQSQRGSNELNMLFSRDLFASFNRPYQQLNRFLEQVS